mmetsp:Transcript_8629/g.13477  ORF Transcript_8629/g.13477 Transcript_8629/m.13477 type:complete len:85 (+) Transcript_8629:1152-1406(+)
MLFSKERNARKMSVKDEDQYPCISDRIREDDLEKSRNISTMVFPTSFVDRLVLMVQHISAAHRCFFWLAAEKKIDGEFDYFFHS